MKKIGNNRYISIILMLFLVVVYSCSPDEEYKATFIYENTTNQSIRIIAYTDYNKSEESWNLFIPPKEMRSTEIVTYTCYSILEHIRFIKLLFDDGQCILYNKLGYSHYKSKTNLFNTSIYDINEDGSIFKLKITEDHYNETLEETTSPLEID